MPAGLQAFDASSNTIVDISDRIAKIFGTLQIGNSYTGGTTSGSVTDSRFTDYAGTTPFYALISSTFFRTEEHPNISIAGNTLSWAFPAGSLRPDTTILYGIF